MGQVISAVGFSGFSLRDEGRLMRPESRDQASSPDSRSAWER